MQNSKCYYLVKCEIQIVRERERKREKACNKILSNILDFK